MRSIFSIAPYDCAQESIGAHPSQLEMTRVNDGTYVIIQHDLNRSKLGYAADEAIPLGKRLISDQPVD